MLTQEDLNQIETIVQKVVRSIVREEVENESQSIKSEFTAELKLTRMGIQNEIEDLTNRIKDLEIRATNNHKAITKKMEEILDVLDKQDMRLLKRVKTIESHLEIAV